VIDGWDKLTDAKREAFNVLVDPLADQVLDGAKQRADAIAVLCDPRVLWKPTYNIDGAVRIWGSYRPGTKHFVEHFYVVVYFERARRAGESWSHYALDAAVRATPSDRDDRRWHYHGDVETGLVDARQPPAYDGLRAKLGGGDYATAMAALRAGGG
jgi:hypothetical protein